VTSHRRLTVQLVRGDGTRIAGLALSARVVLCVLAGLGLATWGAVAIVASFDALTRAGEVAGEENRRLKARLEQVTTEVSTLRREVAGWPALHKRILEAFGPAAGPAGADSGIGGAVVTEPRPGASTELDALAAEIQEAGTSLRALQGLLARASRALAALPSTWPVRGAVNSEFGTRFSPWSGAPEFHAGIDIAAARGTAVLAPAAGTVAFAGPHPEYGLAVIIDHGQEIGTVYAHLSRIRVAAGQRVARGAELAQTGNTGRSSGPHLHYEILVAGRPVNPRTFFWD
jgi:murein DD-endopeptidase MepM/ murein hydrolase activator NlpD